MTLDGFSQWLARLLRLTPVSLPPTAFGESARVFQAAPGYYSYQLLVWAWGQLSAAAALLLGFLAIFPGIPFDVPFRWWPAPLRNSGLLEMSGAALFLAQLVVTYVLIGLDYRFRWYVLTDRSLRIREGLFRVKEQTITFANVQNVSLRQGPLQRWFGIADLEVRTAGGGDAPGGQDKEKTDGLHIGRLRGLEDAARIREQILADLRRHPDAGLGDRPTRALPQPRQSSAPPSAELAAAAKELIREVRSLRGLLETAPNRQLFGKTRDWAAPD